MIVAIDGPAGAGKSSVSRALANALGFRFLDTGAMYRAVTWQALADGIELPDDDAVESLAQRIDLTIDGDQVTVDGCDVTDLIRSPEVTESVRHIADNVAVRIRLTELQRKAAQGVDLVTEGRDQGSTVFPDAECKIYLTASDEERARRRHLELLSRGVIVSRDEILKQQRARDRQDRCRDFGALRKADDAIEVVTDGLSSEEVVKRLEQIVRQAYSRS